MQAVRYAASVAKLDSIDSLVQHMYARYIEKFEPKALKEAGGLTPEEFGRRRLKEFLGDAEPTLNKRQRIVLVGAEFDIDTKSAAAWLSDNGVDIHVIELRPVQFGKEYFLDAQVIIPPPRITEFYADLIGPRGAKRAATDSGDERISRTNRPKLGDMLTAGVVAAGDPIAFSKRRDDTATIVDGKRCKFDSKTVRINDWATSMSGWSAVNIYDWIVHIPTGKRLGELRDEFEAKQEADEEPAGE
jgi:hypothetical protein